MRKLITTAAIGIMTVASFSTAYAADEFNTAPGLTAAGAPLALQGVDPVALLDLQNRVDGSAEFTSVHNGVAYYFDSAESQKTFDANPDRYVPQNGGFCTFGVSVGKKFDGDPQYAAVVDDKLYVFLNEGIYRMYQKDKKSTLKKARKNWTEIEHTAAADL